MSKEKLDKYLYKWPYFNPSDEKSWEKQENSQFVRFLPEKKGELELDSRWPGFFPSPICFVTTSDGEITALEKVVGASIVNRFPYIIALSFCIEPLSKRHYVRSRFMETLEKGEAVSVHYFEPGDDIDAIMKCGIVYGKLDQWGGPWQTLAKVYEAGALSPFGTMGQGGNAMEWTESEADGVNSSTQNMDANREVLGGGIGNNADGISSTALSTPYPDYGYSFGFRVAMVPETSALSLFAVGLGALAMMRRRRS